MNLEGHYLIGKYTSYDQARTKLRGKIVKLRRGPMMMHAGGKLGDSKAIRATLEAEIEPDNGEPNFWTQPFFDEEA